MSDDKLIDLMRDGVDRLRQQGLTEPTLYLDANQAINFADRCAKIEDDNKALAEALREIINHWDTPAWKYEQPTAKVIGKARAALAKHQGDKMSKHTDYYNNDPLTNIDLLIRRDAERAEMMEMLKRCDELFERYCDRLMLVGYGASEYYCDARSASRKLAALIAKAEGE